MGNYSSCDSSKVPSNVVKIIALHGNVQESERPMKAAELMLDNPQHFLCDCTAVQTGRRILALSADEELQLGHLYFLLPMSKLHSPLSPSEMASLACKSDSALHKSTSNSTSLAKILPVLADLCQCCADRNLDADYLNGEITGVKETAQTEGIVFVPKLQVFDAEDLRELRGFNMSCKYWKPALETISESPRSVMSSNLPIAPPLLRQLKKGNRLAHSYAARSLSI